MSFSRPSGVFVPCWRDSWLQKVSAKPRSLGFSVRPFPTGELTDCYLRAEGSLASGTRGLASREQVTPGSRAQQHGAMVLCPGPRTMLMGSEQGERWTGGCWRGSHPAGKTVPAVHSQGPGGRKVSQPCKSTKLCPFPQQTQLPLVESVPQHLTKRRLKSGRWGGSTFSTLLPMSKPAYAEPSQTPSRLRDLQVLEPCSFSWHSSMCLSSALTGLRCRSLSTRPWTGRQKAWLSAKGPLHTLSCCQHPASLCLIFLTFEEGKVAYP